MSALADWLAERRGACRLDCRPIPLAASRDWRLEDGAIVHREGAFFSVVGVRARSSRPELDGLQQPLILQPEVGILGFLLRRPAEAPELLVQAKAEPGNVDRVQLAPTVQATESNYRRRHGGAPTAYLSWFDRGEPTARVLADALQSEQGGRFLGKYNRNVTVAAPGAGPEPAGDLFRWAPVAEVLALLHADFAVNTDARSSLVGSDWRALARGGEPFARADGDGFGVALRASWEADGAIDGVSDRLRAMVDATPFDLERVPLDALAGWRLESDGVFDANGAGFDVAFFDVACPEREVARWDQPLAAARHEQDAVLLAQHRDGVLRLLLRGSPELGFTERVQLGPTAMTGLPCGAAGDLAAFALGGAGGARVRADVRQSDEGGRFFRSVARYRLLEVAEDVAVPEDPLAVWVTVAQVERLLRERGLLTNEARSLLSLLLRWL